MTAFSHLNMEQPANPINEARLQVFLEFLNESWLGEKKYRHILFLLEFISGKHPPELVSRSFLFEGEPGTGKTYLAERMLESINLPILYMGTSGFRHPCLIPCKTLNQVASKAKTIGSCVVFLDDLQFILKYTDFMEIDYEHKRGFMEVLDAIKKNPCAVFIATSNEISMDGPMRDRIDVHLDVGLPSDAHRKNFLAKAHSAHLSQELVDFISSEAVGYNYRELTELVRRAYREGNGSITIPSVKEAIKNYIPSSLSGFTIVRQITLRLNDILGKDHIKRHIRRAIEFASRIKELKKIGIRRPNILLFHGPPGTGKTHMARAIAGETGWPFINITARYIERHGIGSIETALRIATRFKKCVLFIDDVDALLGRDFQDQDSFVQGMLYSALDSVEGPQEAIIILAMNMLNRFGMALQDRATIIKFEKPDEQEREAFFTKRASDSSLQVDPRMLAKQTGKLTFRHLEKVWDDIAFQYLETGDVAEDDVELITQSYRKSREERMFG